MGFATLHEVLRQGEGNFGLEVFNRKELDPLVWWALDESQRWQRRVCTLDAPLVFWGTLSLSLYRSSSIVNCFRQVFDAARGFEDVAIDDVTDEAIYHARARLGHEPLRLFCQALGRKWRPAASFLGLIPLAMDGVHFNLPASPENDKEFGRPKASRGETAFPQLGGVGLLYTDTRQFIDCVWGSHKLSELAAAESLVQHVGPEHVTFLDRRYTKIDLWFKFLERGSHIVHRLSAKYQAQQIQELGPGDWLAAVNRLVPIPPEQQEKCHGRGGLRKWRQETRIMRVIKYQIGQRETVRLITDLLDPVKYPAAAIAVGYHQRWEIELAYDEVKTHLSTVLHGSLHTTFRSRKPAGIYQEAWALIATYQLIRGLMVDAGERHKVPPLEISFVDTVEAIKRALPKLQYCPTHKKTRLYRRLLADVAATRNARPRRKRAIDRVVKQKMSNWRLKRSNHRSKRHDFVAELRLVS